MTLPEKQWQAFSQVMCLDPKQLEALRLAYYGGMLAMFVLWTDAPQLKPQIERELDDFLKTIPSRLLNPLNPTKIQ